MAVKANFPSLSLSLSGSNILSGAHSKFEIPIFWHKENEEEDERRKVFLSLSPLSTHELEYFYFLNPRSSTQLNTEKNPKNLEYKREKL